MLARGMLLPPVLADTNAADVMTIAASADNDAADVMTIAVQ